MPRIRPSVFLRARSIDKALPALLPICRDTNAALNELRWLHEHATFVCQRIEAVNHHALLRSFVVRRARGEPLQYILGSEYFGNLEIKCRPGVLIPRPETASSVSFLASLLQPETDERSLRVLDLCTGSGCIPLLFHDEFYKNPSCQNHVLDLIGVDISPHALSLAKENLLHQIANDSNRENPYRTRSLNRIGFIQADILRGNEHGQREQDLPLSLDSALQRLSESAENPAFDILISNPPYISPTAFLRTTARSVRAFEPKLALVPPSPSPSSPPQNSMPAGDIFYPTLLNIASRIDVKILLFEVADMDQAKRVASLVIDQGIFGNLEIWRDEPGHPSPGEEVNVGDRRIRVRGRGNGRSVFAWGKSAASMLKD